MTSPTSSERTAWRIVVILSVISAGAAIGDESAHYFWDLTSYVEALDSPFPYRAQRTYPFLYPPFAADLFSLARTHLFELASIAYAGAGVLFLGTLLRLEVPRKFEWLFAVTAMGGLGVVSLKSGNVAIAMNFVALAFALMAAAGKAPAGTYLLIAIGAGALIKPQFIVYLPLLLCLEPARKASIRIVMTAVAVVAVYAGYMMLRPFDWNEYVQAVANRTLTEQDYGWGPAALIKHVSDSNAAALIAYAAGFLVVAALSWAPLRRFIRDGDRISAVCLAFFVLTFINPRLPLYDVYAAAVALGICCALAGPVPAMAWVLAFGMAVNLVPWTITEFAREPAAWPSWMQNLLAAHVVGVGSLLIALRRAPIGRSHEYNTQIHSARG
jgi:hypothetical protein